LGGLLTAITIHAQNQGIGEKCYLTEPRITRQTMKLHLASRSGSLYLFTAYGSDHVEINQQRHVSALLLQPERQPEDWEVAGFSALQPAHFARIAERAPTLVLLGTGKRLRFPAPALTRPLIDARIGLEVMDIGALCRTYNILAGEGRNVCAAVLFDPPD
jgi:uncharacterized protein